MSCVSITSVNQLVMFRTRSDTDIVYRLEWMTNERKKSGFKRLVIQFGRRMLWTSARKWRKLFKSFGEYWVNDATDNDIEVWTLIIENKALIQSE